MKQHIQQPHKPTAQVEGNTGERTSESREGECRDQAQKEGARAKGNTESNRAERTLMQHDTGQSTKRPTPAPAEDDRAAAQEGQMSQNQQRLGQHQSSRKQP